MGEGIKIEVYRGQEAGAIEQYMALKNSRDFLFFQSPLFLKLWDGLEGFEPWAFLYYNEDQLTAGIFGVFMNNPLGRSTLSSRFISWGGPVLFNKEEFEDECEKPAFVPPRQAQEPTTADREDECEKNAFNIPRQVKKPATAGEEDEEVTTALLNSLKKELPSSLVYIEIRNLSNRSELRNAFIQTGFSEIPYINMLIPLAKDRDAFAAFTNARRRQVRQARDAGVEVREARTADEVRMWYFSLKKHYRKLVRKPLPSLDFFLNFFLMTRQHDCGKVFLAFHHGVVIGGAVVPASLKEKRAYVWYISSERKVKGSSSPASLLYYHIMDYFSQKGFNYLDLMGGGVKDKPSGVRQYKRAFGAQEKVDGRFLLIRRPLVYAIGKMVINMFRK